MRFLIVMMLLLTGCASQTPGFIVAPQLFWPQSTALQQSQFAFNVTDSRGQPYTLRLQKDGKVQHIHAANDIRAQLQNVLSQTLIDQGAVVSPDSSTIMTVRINQLQSIVEQRTLEHSVTNQVALTVYIESPSGTFSKSYSGDSSFTAPFKMDVAAVERELRVLTEQVLTQLMQDTSWHSALRG